MAKRATVTGSVVATKKAPKAAKLRGAASFLENGDREVASDLAGTIELSSFRKTAPAFSRRDRLTAIEQALLLIEDNYVNLPLKRAMHAVNPVQQLRLLYNSTKSASDFDLPPAAEFHRSMIEIFMSVRDLHTNYILPSPYNAMTAFLPFLVEPFYEGGKRRYLVSHVTASFQDPPFEKGVEILAWNGIPIERAVALNGNRYAGSNLESRHARGVDTLTVRPLIINLPPDEDWVILTYLALDGTEKEVRVRWLVYRRTSALEHSPVPSSPDEARMAYDIDSRAAAEVKQLLFAPHAVAAQRRIASGDAMVAGSADQLQTSLPAVLQAKSVSTGNGPLGYFRIRTFEVEPEVFIPEVVRLIQQLPGDGLIIDVRGNGGGYIESGERMLQLLTPRAIEPEPVQFLTSSVNLRICERHAPSTIPGWEDFDLSAHLDSMRDALRTGAVFSNGVPITPVNRANDIGQIYHGPVVLITDGLCFSTTDIFAAGFQDHEIGPILGVHGNTGAGGANVWTHSLLKHLFDAPVSEPDSRYKSLPADMGLRVAIRRTLRVGKRAGTPVEDLGVTPSHRHNMTRNDLLSSNVDLIEQAARLLDSLPKRQLRIRLESQSDTQLVFAVDCLGLERLDFYGAGRPEGSLEVTDGEIEATLPNRGFSSYEVRGYAAGSQVATRRLAV